MKKIMLLVLCLAFFEANAQKITKEFLIGKWISDSDKIEFSIENKKEFKIVTFSTLTGNYFKVKGYQFNKGFFYLNTIHESNNWESIGKFIFIDEDTMVADYVSDAPGQVIYKRVLGSNNE
jgi:hypothetical protein